MVQGATYTAVQGERLYTDPSLFEFEPQSRFRLAIWKLPVHSAQQTRHKIEPPEGRGISGRLISDGFSKYSRREFLANRTHSFLEA